MVTRSLTFSSCAVLNYFGLEGHPVPVGSPHIDPGPDSLATIRSSLPIARVFRQKQCFVVRVDYAGKHELRMHHIRGESRTRSRRSRE